MGERVWLLLLAGATLAVVREASILQPSSLSDWNLWYNTVLPWDQLFKPEEMYKQNRKETAQI